MANRVKFAEAVTEGSPKPTVKFADAVTDRGPTTPANGHRLANGAAADATPGDRGTASAPPRVAGDTSASFDLATLKLLLDDSVSQSVAALHQV